MASWRCCCCFLLDLHEGVGLGAVVLVLLPPLVGRGQSQPHALLLQKRSQREESREIHRMRISVRIVFQCFSVIIFELFSVVELLGPDNSCCLCPWLNHRSGGWSSSVPPRSSATSGSAVCCRVAVVAVLQTVAARTKHATQKKRVNYSVKWLRDLIRSNG